MLQVRELFVLTSFFAWILLCRCPFVIFYNKLSFDFLSQLTDVNNDIFFR